jgi:hypothetical protein
MVVLKKPSYSSNFVDALLVGNARVEGLVADLNMSMKSSLCSRLYN